MIDNTEFFKACKERYGDKVAIEKINLPDHCEITEDELASYPEMAWVKGGRCPECNAALLGWSGSFQWDLPHGVGHCGACRLVDFKLLHYIGDKRFEAVALIGFVDLEV